MAIRQATTPQHDAGTVLERKEQALKPPAMYKVLLLNDDYTPMEFVVMILQQRKQQMLHRNEFVASLAGFDKRHVQADFQFLRDHASSITHCSGWPACRAWVDTNSTFVAAISRV